ncbi:hypothetical protein PHSY_004694 [Pseudozyma hubeiensis SY62]|uniref:Uncharacterized protein n=1 Tax=Pseudozyma hubeiensis (strain SY62) TaxID=1305764 RepID=R9PG66_PSEHS|nr:hypothetical protein PHSY_004694 [Pseudozyma hubeiensis SY62]GAC97110.1 hypothetical protein PHSY_004694 [Pseudozyma hubeiensis SY62]
MHVAPQQWPTSAAVPSASTTSGSLQDLSNGCATLCRAPSGRFRMRVPSFTKQVKTSEVAQPTTSANNAASNPHGKAWQPRWAPKLKRTQPSESLTTYSPILDSSLSAFPSFVASPPPAVQLDDAGFGRPFSTSGLLDLNASRFSFLDMGNKDNDSDSDSSDSHDTPAFVRQLPTIQEPLASPHAQVRPPLTTASSDYSDAMDPATASSSLQPEPSRGMLTLASTPSPASTEQTRAGRPSLTAPSPALASLISSFPNPLTRGDSAYAPPSSLEPLPSQSLTDDVSASLSASSAMRKENSWDGGEHFDVQGYKHDGVAASHASTELPYLDMDDEDESGTSHDTIPDTSSGTMHSQPTATSMAPSMSRQARNPPPRPAPTMALPDLPPHAALQAPLRRHTPTSSVQLDAQQQLGSAHSSGASTKSVQRPLILPALRSSASIDRLAAMSQSNSSPLDANGSGLKSLSLAQSASTEELVRSLDIPRDTVQQMLDTTQHVWRNHLLGSSALLGDAVATNEAGALISRSSSSPMLSTLFASHRSSEELSKGSLAKPTAGKGNNRTSMLGLPYISSSKPSFEYQSPGWALSKASAEGPRPSALELQAERAKHRRTFLGRSSEDGLAGSYNFSRPIRRDITDLDPGMLASASMPSLAAAREAPKPPALLQSPLLLKGESEATGFAQFAVDDEQEVLVDSGSETHMPFVVARGPLEASGASGASPVDRTARSEGHKPVPALPHQKKMPSPRLVRRNSDTVLNLFAPEFGKRAPGELHAWSVCIDNDGVPAIRPSPSAFHRPNCSLAGKTNATWQCGCRTSISNDSSMATPSLGNPAATGQSSPGRSRSLSAGNVLDPIRQAQLWSQVERNKELIRRHEQEIAGLQQQVVRISSEMASAGRPSFSSSIATPDLASAAIFPAPPARADVAVQKTLPGSTSKEPQRPPVPAKAMPASAVKAQTFPRASAAPLSEVQTSAPPAVNPPRTLRGRIASLSKINLVLDEGASHKSSSSNSGHSQLRTSSSTSSLNKVFRFPWSRSSDNKENAFPLPTPFPMGHRSHSKAASTTSLHRKALPRPQMYAVDEQRPLPAPPISETNLSGKDKRYPPSSRKYTYDMLHGPAFHTSVGSRHLRGRSGSSKSSSFGTSIFSSNDGHEIQESSRFASFPRLGRRWDSISSRGTNASARNSAEVQAHQNMASHGSMPALSAVVAKPMPPLPSDAGTGSRRSKTPPPRRSSLMRRSLEAAPPKRTPIPNEFLQANDAVMAPISEQNETGSPASARLNGLGPELELSPASVVGASPAGPARMSMSERYRLQGLTVPAPLALSSSLSSPALGSATLGPDSATKVGAAESVPRGDYGCVSAGSLARIFEMQVGERGQRGLDHPAKKRATRGKCARRLSSVSVCSSCRLRAQHARNSTCRSHSFNSPLRSAALDLPRTVGSRRRHLSFQRDSTIRFTYPHWLPADFVTPRPSSRSYHLPSSVALSLATYSVSIGIVTTNCNVPHRILILRLPPRQLLHLLSTARRCYSIQFTTTQKPRRSRLFSHSCNSCPLPHRTLATRNQPANSTQWIDVSTR